MSKTPESKSKKLFYRRASWRGDNKLILEDLLKGAHDKFSTSGERMFAGSHGTVIQGARYTSDPENGILLQIAASVPDQPTSAIKKPSSAASSEIEIVPSPPGTDFLDGDAFVLVKKNHVILCQSGIRENTALKYMVDIINKFGLTREAAGLTLEKIAKSDKIKMLKAEGVKSIELNASLYDASIRQIERTEENEALKVSSLPTIVADYVLKLFAKNQKMKNVIASENLNIKLVLSFDGREARKHAKDETFGVIGKQRLEEVSEKILNEIDQNNIE
jgi:hypothetical protein